ncbi:IQ motif, EF-hand binding site [Plasmopara halstedii]|uniref:IQ motif, EF-hand binding site n=1 Tax=Plasmopara halstedii TaxID=4781 RepID=A0A0N7L5N7_PLAHL|nr:IQ motif, EF-hand binding site [Plasmopara halstedii]CEG41987.1 IQ motif, EF-hand binding site [Plasmopara halstedii]|eukprot:XP_024578356.1 IQ motif, EF-hand binding site [Plasmopara halstedii]
MTETTDAMYRLKELGLRHGRFQSKFRTRREPKTRRTKKIRRGFPWESTFMRKSKAEKMEIIMKPWLYPMAAQNLSAILIQKRARGMLCRMHWSSGFLTFKAAQRLHEGGNTMADTQFRSPIQQFVANGGNYFDESGFYTFVVTKIQAWFKMQRLRWRRVLDRYPLYHIAALQLQYAWKVYRQQKLNERQARSPTLWSAMSSVHRAALCIQTFWKSYSYRRIFQYYRDLLTFRGTGDPVQMLRAINPSEASLLDASMSAQVRFRLGGLTFPPTVYYKIFTRKPVCDLGVFSPKDYTISRKSASVTHSQVKSRINQYLYIRVGNSYYRAQHQMEDTRLWYSRLENNGWRPVTAKVLAEANADPITRTTGSRYTIGGNYHYSKLVRLQDRERTRRNKKRLWMQKLYAQGLLSESTHLRHENEHRSIAFDVDFDDEKWETEAEEMFQWASALDYDEYVNNWYDLGRTAATGDELAESLSNKIIRSSFDLRSAQLI